MSKVDISSISEEYHTHISDLDRFRDALLLQVQELLEINKVALGFRIESRTKTLESISEKVTSGRYTVKKSLLEMQDLVGLRIILLFKRDVDKVSKLIESNLTVHNKYDTIEKLKDDQFGYSSIHFNASIPKEWKSVPTFRGLQDYHAEIQIRTLAQHTWAEASKELQYKKEENIPKPLLRSIGRVSALLEIVDFEFERLLHERDEYILKAEELVKSNVQSELNVDILQALLENHLPSENKRGSDPFDSLLVDLRHFKIDNKEKLEELIEKHKSTALTDDKEAVASIRKTRARNIQTSSYSYDSDRLDKGVFYTHVGLVRQILSHEFKEKWRAYITSKSPNTKNK